MQLRPGLLLLSLCCGEAAMAQRDVEAAGGDASGSGGTVSFSLGQIADEGQGGGDGSVSQGVQQVYPDGTTGVPAIVPDALARAYPTATNDVVNLWLPQRSEAWSLTLFDPSGRIVLTASSQSGHQELSLSALANGIYQLRVSDAAAGVQTFTILRTDHP